MTAKYDTYVCYKCEANEVSAPLGTVHPLCSVCYEEHEDWFAEQLLLLEGRAT
jgi:hypothetical protein